MARAGISRQLRCGARPCPRPSCRFKWRGHLCPCTGRSRVCPGGWRAFCKATVVNIFGFVARWSLSQLRHGSSGPSVVRDGPRTTQMNGCGDVRLRKQTLDLWTAHARMGVHMHTGTRAHCPAVPPHLTAPLEERIGRAFAGILRGRLRASCGFCVCSPECPPVTLRMAAF